MYYFNECEILFGKSVSQCLNLDLLELGAFNFKVLFLSCCENDLHFVCVCVCVEEIFTQ